VDDTRGRGLRLEVVDCGHLGGGLQVNEALGGKGLFVVVEVGRLWTRLKFCRRSDSLEVIVT
jgi:hypothetical protein